MKSRNTVNALYPGHWGLVLLCLVLFSIGDLIAQVQVSFDRESKPITFGVSRLEKALQRSGQKPSGIVIEVSADAELQPGGFRYVQDQSHSRLIVRATTDAGAMYGALDLAEQIGQGKKWQSISDRVVNPHFTVRAIKFNLPWSPYRTGPTMTQHIETCRDLKFWQSFLDQMAENRFNVLSLWNVHPFSFMVKPTHFPEANNFSAKEMAEWKQFWTALFRMARDRGIEPFIVNWNIAVSPEFAEHYHVMERNDTSGIVKQYTREMVTQVINEYPDLAGIGITLADWMSNFTTAESKLPAMSPKDREDWIEATVVAGIKAANRPVKLIHRSVLSSDPKEMRRVIDNAKLPDTTLVEVKFNWSHGHSTPSLLITHDSNSGAKDDGYWNPIPDNYRIEWMIRNEDFFILRWGQPDFIRSHIATNSKPFVNGYFVGSEGYIPARDYSHLPGPHVTWKYAFEKQWLFYLEWGRLLYDPSTSNQVFESAFESRYGKGLGVPLLKIYSVAGKMPLRLASYFRSTWDYTLYSEGFLSPSPAGGLNDKVSTFISIDELINHPTLDPGLQSIADFVKTRQKVVTGVMSPLLLADSLQASGRFVLDQAKQIRKKVTAGPLACELDDAETWAWLSIYFADKIRAGVALEVFRSSGDKLERQKAVDLLKKCKDHWIQLSNITSGHYREVPFIDDKSDASTFSWRKFMGQVERDLEIAER